jgi:hypothetical protein
MGEEKTEGILESKTHKFALGGRVVALASLLFLVPMIRKYRVQHQKSRRHFPILGH